MGPCDAIVATDWYYELCYVLEEEPKRRKGVEISGLQAPLLTLVCGRMKLTKTFGAHSTLQR